MTARLAEADEETPLLGSDSHGQPKRIHHAIPWAQFSIILVLQLAEPLTSQVIYPFAPELIRNIGITHGDETRVGYYVGLMQSIFFATQAMTVMHWSRISDHIGRRPVIMTGLVGLSLSMYCFGLSRTFWGLVISRSLNGALNGNIGVMKSMLAEITDPSNMAQAYAYMPIAWSTGATLGPIIGGSLSRPADRYPNVFGHIDFLKQYPYFLACAIPATFSATACLITFFFLKETVKNPLSLRKILRLSPKEVAIERDALQVAKSPVVNDDSRPLPLRQLLTPRVIVAAGNYAFLAIVDITLRAVQPVFYSTPIALGGLGLDPQVIGSIMSLYGIINGLTQIFLFGKIHDRFGTKRVYIVGIASVLPVFGLFPVINELARLEGLSTAVWALTIGQALLSIIINFAYGCVFIFITASSPNKASLGSVNGIAQMLVSIMRAVGPAAANSLFSLSIDKEHHYMGGYFVYYAMSTLVCAALWVATYLPDRTASDEPQVVCEEES
ncbi:MFS general substrate transporter [Lentinus tigrinus ALCF2SS1-7]|uniref:MFS general substrate transporter n=1 Tax=Lentinus tigrinus ALCF2SS1-6 TaxID=1328759 RepID=A0A5C2SBS7_9APHY|nr:MFS general substrate transporter [Lentinus tigrinus ALCF2SS1-6]RPD75199.1 MFS general substrate transporter [Lentinus tigrinus ALCF2SS1-7]